MPIYPVAPGKKLETRTRLREDQAIIIQLGADEEAGPRRHRCSW